MLNSAFKGVAMAMLCLILSPFVLHAQNDPYFLVVTRAHFNPQSDFTLDEWKAHEKVFFENVTKKNELVVGANVLMHYYTNDNSEVLFATIYRNWGDIEKANAKNDELIKAAWPDESQRRAFFDKQSSFYLSKHSDEIYTMMPNTKPFTGTTEQVYYMQTRHRAFPADRKEGEFTKLMDEFAKNVTLKNKLLNGYYPLRHIWGSDGREYLETYVFNSLSDLEKSVDENEALIKAHWADETKRKEFFASLNKYFERWHGDALYRHVPELRKQAVALN